MFCNGSHGISVGSLGQYPGGFDIVENVYIYNTSLHNASVSGKFRTGDEALINYYRMVLASRSGPTPPRHSAVISKEVVDRGGSTTSPMTP